MEANRRKISGTGIIILVSHISRNLRRGPSEDEESEISANDLDECERMTFSRTRLVRRNAVDIDDSVNLRRKLDSYIVLKSIGMSSLENN